ncbi:MAG TPA: cupin domain-containing protein [Stellaceae bacterium]|nr:cupin domain-containing protein [Stellaceae bacterium]
MAKPVRRVVTGHNAAGKSIFVEDAAATMVNENNAGVTVTELWETRATPASNAGADDPTKHAFRLMPPKNGSNFRVIEYLPDKQRVAALKGQPGAAHNTMIEGYQRDLANKRHPGFHKTNTVDYAIVLSGEIWALMDEGEVLLKTGDVLIQRGTSHAWSVRTDAPATVAFVLIDAEPL